MEQTLDRFVIEWNRLFENMVFSYQKAPVTERVTDVEVRFTVPKDWDMAKKWNKLASEVELKSHETMFVATNKDLFSVGIIGIKVASQSKDYEERLIIETLNQLAKDFLPYLVIA